MNVILVLVFFLSLMFLAMIFGEQLSLFEVFDGRWLTAPFDMLSRFWGMVCEATDRVWCFVFAHFWWVAATVSGGIGVLLVAFIMVSGLANEAAAVRHEERAIMHVGSVLDHTRVLDTGNILATNEVVNPHEITQLVYQTPSRDFFPLPELIRRPVVRDVPPLPLNPYREPIYQRGRLSLTMEPIERAEERTEQIGRPVRSLDMDRLIDSAVRLLRRDDWHTSSDILLSGRFQNSSPAMVENSELAVRDLTSRVRVIPGYTVSSRHLKVEKFAPSRPARGDFEIQIHVTNLSNRRISGLIVRELLPMAWDAKQMMPEGVYRDSTATWLLEDLAPLEDQILTLQVASTESGPFQSMTEVSAITAVTTQTRVAPAFQPLPPVERPAARPLTLPDLRLILEQPPQSVDVNGWTTAYFRIENVGDAPAVGVTLRVTLPAGLDHHALNEDDIDRVIDSNVRRLEAGQSRRTELKVSPTFRGRHFATAELRLQNTQLDLRDFEIIGRDSANDQPPPTPVPDFR